MEWISVDKALPGSGTKVIATYMNSWPKRRTIMAEYIERWSTECSWDEECNSEYHEEKDDYFLKEGWYECIENWDDFSSVFVSDGEITHWRMLDEPPK